MAPEASEADRAGSCIRRWGKSCLPEGTAAALREPGHVGRPLLLLLLLGLALRLAVVAALPRGLEGDASQYAILASNVAAGQGFSAAVRPPFPPDVTRTPGYVAFVLPAVGFFPDPAPVIYALQILADLGTVALLYLLAGPSPRRAALAAALYALHPLAAAAAGQALPDTLANLLLVLWLGLRARPVGGLVAAGLAMTKPALLPFTLVAQALANRRGAALLLLLLVPWALRNLHVSGSPAPAGFGATLWYGIAREAHLTAEGEADWRRYEDLWRGEPVPPAEVRALDARLGRIARAAIRRDPAGYARHAAARFAAFWGRPEGLGQYLAVGDLPRAAILVHATVGFQAVLLVLAALGLVRSRSEPDGVGLHLALLLYLSCLYPPVHVEGRYLLPALPSLCLLASRCVSRSP